MALSWPEWCDVKQCSRLCSAPVSDAPALVGGSVRIRQSSTTLIDPVRIMCGRIAARITTVSDMRDRPHCYEKFRNDTDNMDGYSRQRRQTHSFSRRYSASKFPAPPWLLWLVIYQPTALVPR